MCIFGSFRLSGARQAICIHEICSNSHNAMVKAISWPTCAAAVCVGTYRCPWPVGYGIVIPWLIARCMCQQHTHTHSRTHTNRPKHNGRMLLCKADREGGRWKARNVLTRLAILASGLNHPRAKMVSIRFLLSGVGSIFIDTRSKKIFTKPLGRSNRILNKMKRTHTHTRTHIDTLTH